MSWLFFFCWLNFHFWHFNILGNNYSSSLIIFEISTFRFIFSQLFVSSFSSHIPLSSFRLYQISFLCWSPRLYIHNRNTRLHSRHFNKLEKKIPYSTDLKVSNLTYSLLTSPTFSTQRILNFFRPITPISIPKKRYSSLKLNELKINLYIQSVLLASFL